MTIWVNGELVEDAAIRQERKLMRQRLTQQWPAESAEEIESKAREWAFENVVERVLLRQAAREFGAASPLPAGDTHRSIAPLDDRLNGRGEADGRMAAFLRYLTRNVPRPTTREVSDHYRKNGKLFFLPERVHASHIVKNVEGDVSEAEARLQIEHAQRALLSGRTFSEVADEYSDCPGLGGDLSWFSRGEMVEEFESVVFALKPTQVSPIFRSPFGFHLAQLHERKPAGIPPLREVYGRVEEDIVKRRHDEVLARFLDEARAKADIRHSPSHDPDAIS